MPFSNQTLRILRGVWKLRGTGESFEEYLAEFERSYRPLFEQARWYQWEAFHDVAWSKSHVSSSEPEPPEISSHGDDPSK
jgi:hypothetical protein